MVVGLVVVDGAMMALSSVGERLCDQAVEVCVLPLISTLTCPSLRTQPA
jgi:hypothetical protein